VACVADLGLCVTCAYSAKPLYNEKGSIAGPQAGLFKTSRQETLVTAEAKRTSIVTIRVDAAICSR